MLGLIFWLAGIVEGIVRPAKDTLLPRSTAMIAGAGAVGVSLVDWLFWGLREGGFIGEWLLISVAYAAFFILGTWISRGVAWLWGWWKAAARDDRTSAPS